jgi:hypothetical protein
MNITLRTNPADDQSSKYKKDIPFFKDGTPEEYVQWTTHLESVIQGLNITTGPNYIETPERLINSVHVRHTYSYF